jgi:hypothetical protein
MNTTVKSRPNAHLKPLQKFRWLGWLETGDETYSPTSARSSAYDWQWIAGMFDRAGMDNPFGYSGRRISDFWAGLNRDWSDTQGWKRFRS